MSTSSQYLSVPQLSHRPSQHRNDRGPRRPAQSPQAHHRSVAAGHAASSSKVKLEDTPLGTRAPLGTSTPTQKTSPVQTVRTLSPTPASSTPATPPSHTPPSPRSSTVQYHIPPPQILPLNVEFNKLSPTKQ